MSYRFVLPQRVNKIFGGIAEFDIKRQLGSGALSTVHEAIHRPTGQAFAIKRIELNKIGVMDQENIEKEIDAHRVMDHKNIVRLHDFFMEGRVVYLVLEHCRHGNLFRYINRQGKLTEDEVKKFFYQTCEAIAYMHQKKYINRDLKPENILLDDENNVKLCDFGWACHLNETVYRRLKAGTYAYMSPENLSGALQDEASDIWSLGILLYELLYNKEPFSGISCNDQLKKIKQNSIDFAKREISSEAKHLITKILQLDKNSRPSIGAVLNSDFLNHGNKSTRNSYNARVFTQLENENKNLPVLTEVQSNNVRDLRPPNQLSSLQHFYNPKKNFEASSISNLYKGFRSQNVSRENSVNKHIVVTTSRPVSIENKRAPSNRVINTNLYTSIGSHYTSHKYVSTPRSIRYNSSSQSFHDYNNDLLVPKTANIYMSSTQNFGLNSNQRHSFTLNHQINTTYHRAYTNNDLTDTKKFNGFFRVGTGDLMYTGDNQFQTFRSKRV